VLAAVTQDGCALSYASKELRADREVVLAAVTQDGCALSYASKELRADREVVLAAVKDFGCVLKYASRKLRKDVLVRFAAGRSFKTLKGCFEEISKIAEYDVTGNFTEEAIQIMMSSKGVRKQPEILKKVETFVAEASHPKNGVLAKRDRDLFEKDFAEPTFPTEFAV